MVVVVIVLMAMLMFLISMLVDGYHGNWHRDRNRMRVGQAMAMMAVTVAGVHDTRAQGERPEGSGEGKFR